MKRRLLALVMALALCIGLLTVSALAAEEEAPDAAAEVSFEEDLAVRLRTVGLFLGVGETPDGGVDFALDRAPTRAEALTMLVRSLGKEDEALAMETTHPFTDVPAWADGYVSYAYSAGLTKGVAATLFDPDSPASAEMYLTFMLRALGYPEGETGAFAWDSPWAMAAECQILPVRVDRDNFLRSDVVEVTAAALFACCAGTEDTLADRLIADGAVDELLFQSVFADDPFEDYHQMDEAVSAVIEERQPQPEKNQYIKNYHIILDAVAEDDGTIAASVLVCSFDAKLLPNSAVGTQGTGTGLWAMTIDPVTMTCTDSLMPNEWSESGTPADYFTERALKDQDRCGKGFAQLAYWELTAAMANGSAVYQPLSYDEAMTVMTTQYLNQVDKTLEAGPCTVVAGWLNGTPHGSIAGIYLVYKAGSERNEGTIVQLPLPIENYMGKTSLPETMTLSDDGLTLTYAYTYDEALNGEDGVVLHPAGTITYTTNLVTGETTQTVAN